MWNSETRAIRKISKILGRLDEEAASRVARGAADAYGLVEVPKPEQDAPAREEAPSPSSVPAYRRPAEIVDPATATSAGAAAAEAVPDHGTPPADDGRPAFLQTQFRMDVGKLILEAEKDREPES